MRAIFKGALIGGAVGATVTTVQATRADDDPPDTVAIAALKGAAEGALAGGLIGAFFDWRRGRCAPEASAGAPVAALATARDALDAARPSLESAAVQAQERAAEAAEAARPHLEAAAAETRELVQEALEAARPHLEAAASRAQQRAWDAAERATPLISDLAEEARRRAPAVLESTIGDGPVIVVKRPAA